jgi:hypothetical protein
MSEHSLLSLTFYFIFQLSFWISTINWQEFTVCKSLHCPSSFCFLNFLGTSCSCLTGTTGLPVMHVWDKGINFCWKRKWYQLQVQGGDLTNKRHLFLRTNLVQLQIQVPIQNEKLKLICHYSLLFNTLMRSGLWKDKSPSWPSAPYLRERKSDVGLIICQEGNFLCPMTVIITSNYFSCFGCAI